MAAVSGPRTVTPGLVLNLDAANVGKTAALTSVQYLIVAGGGGGGFQVGGGGGGGGVLLGATPVTSQTYTVSVGAGGSGATTTTVAGTNGSDSSAFGLTAVGGGRGANHAQSATPLGIGASGGSGGGGSGNNSSVAAVGGNGVLGQGNAGGKGRAPNGPNSGEAWTGGDLWAGGGGGGAGGNGADSTINARGGVGGVGINSSLSGTSTFYAGGGGGCNSGTAQPRSLGGLGGGGNGRGNSDNAADKNGVPNTGGGGGGVRDSSGAGGAGGSGIVVIRYPGPQRATGGTVTSVEGDTVHTFTTVGSSTFVPFASFANGVAFAGVADLSGLNNFGTAVNGPVYNSDNGGAFVFDGVNDYVDCGNPTSLSSIGGTTNITVSAWVYYTAFGGGGQPYSVITVKGNPWTWLMENPSNTFRFRITAGVTDASLNDTAAHLLNVWYNVVGTYNGTDMRLYVNGVLKNTRAQAGALATNSVTAKIGTYQGTNYNFTGRISNVRIYNRALAAAEIAQNFEAHRGRFGI